MHHLVMSENHSISDILPTSLLLLWKMHIFETKTNLNLGLPKMNIQDLPIVAVTDSLCNQFTQHLVSTLKIANTKFIAELELLSWKYLVWYHQITFRPEIPISPGISHLKTIQFQLKTIVLQSLVKNLKNITYKKLRIFFSIYKKLKSEENI